MKSRKTSYNALEKRIVELEQEVSNLKKELENQKLAETKLQFLFDIIPVGLSVLDENKSLLYLNPVIERIHRTTRNELLQKEHFKRQYFNSERKSIDVEDFPSSRAFKTNKTIENEIIGFKVENGEEVWINVTAIPVNFPDWKVVIVTTDITKQLQFEAQLKALNSTKDKLFSIIAHDLKNPFNTILGFSKQLRKNIERKEFDKAIRFSEIIHQSSQNAFSLLVNLLEWSRSQSGTLIFSPEYCILTYAIEDVMDLLYHSALQKNIQFITTIEPALKIYADRNMITAVLRNLISNAIKYSHKQGTVTITASSNKIESEITIADNGIGMSEENVQKLFNSNKQFSTEGTNNEKGTGLGLVICKEFIEKHGGKILVKSELGKGTEFKIILPQH